MMKKNRYRFGISLLEIMLSLAIIAVILIMATRYYAITRIAQQTNEASEMIIAIYSAGQSWMQTNDNFKKVTIYTFTEAGLLPADFALATANPWGGAISIDPLGTDLQKLEVRLDNVPSKDCQNLLAKMIQKSWVDPEHTGCDVIEDNATFRTALIFLPG